MTKNENDSWGASDSEPKRTKGESNLKLPDILNPDETAAFGIRAVRLTDPGEPAKVPVKSESGSCTGTVTARPPSPKPEPGSGGESGLSSIFDDIEIAQPVARPISLIPARRVKATSTPSLKPTILPPASEESSLAVAASAPAVPSVRVPYENWLRRFLSSFRFGRWLLRLLGIE